MAINLIAVAKFLPPLREKIATFNGTLLEADRTSLI
jgi:hypothetical protein